MFQVFKQILILDKDNLSKMQNVSKFLNDDFSFIEGEKLSNATWPYVKKLLPSVFKSTSFVNLIKNWIYVTIHTQACLLPDLFILYIT